MVCRHELHRTLSHVLILRSQGNEVDIVLFTSVEKFPYFFFFYLEPFPNTYCGQNTSSSECGDGDHQPPALADGCRLSRQLHRLYIQN